MHPIKPMRGAWSYLSVDGLASGFLPTTTCGTTGKQSPDVHLIVRSFALRHGAALATPRPITKNKSSAKRFISFLITVSEDYTSNTGSKTSFVFIA
jgi:hypothetical protein